VDSRWTCDERGAEGHHVLPAADLSPSGAERREEVLIDLQRALASRRRRRLALRWAAVGACGLVLILTNLRRDPGELFIAGIGSDGAARVRIEYVRDDSSILERYQAVSQPQSAVPTVADDGELLALLEEAEVPSGLIRIGNHLILTAFNPLIAPR